MVVFFDGHCNLCNNFVDFLIRRDSRGVLKFASLQGSTAARELPTSYRENLGTVVLKEGDKIFTHSTAALKVIASLGGIYSLASVFLIMPAFIRNFVYHLVAKYRYRIWGRRETCRLPTAEERAHFLD